MKKLSGPRGKWPETASPQKDESPSKNRGKSAAKGAFHILSIPMWSSGRCAPTFPHRRWFNPRPEQFIKGQNNCPHQGNRLLQSHRGRQMLYEDKVGENSPGPAYFRRFLAPRHDRSPPAEAQASFDQYCSTLWSSGIDAPDFATVPVSNPDCCTFSQKFGEFSEKTAPDTASPQSPALSQSPQRRSHPVMRAMKDDNTKPMAEIWKLSGPPL